MSIYVAYLDLMAPVETAWVEAISGKGIDGQAALEELRNIARSNP